MKKVLPLLVFVMLAFAGCQRGPATYEYTKNPHEIAAHAEKFTKQVNKQSKHYTTEDWNFAIDQFVSMSKNYYEFGNLMTTEEQIRYDNARIQFTDAVFTNGSEEMAVQVKKVYSELMGQ